MSSAYTMYLSTLSHSFDISFFNLEIWRGFKHLEVSLHFFQGFIFLASCLVRCDRYWDYRRWLDYGFILSSKLSLVPLLDESTHEVVKSIDAGDEDVVFFFEVTELEPLVPSNCCMEFVFLEIPFDVGLLDDLVDPLADFAVSFSDVTYQVFLVG